MLFNFLSSDAPVWYPILFDTPKNTIRSVAIWLTLALVLTFLVVLPLLKKKGKSTALFLKISLITAVTYAAILGITFLIFSFLDDGIVLLLFIPLVILIVVIAASAITLIFVRTKPVIATLIALASAAVVATLVCMGISYAGEPTEGVDSIALYVSAGITVAALIFVVFYFGRKEKQGFTTKSIAYAAICIAMSFALSYLRIVKMPQGGSITIASLLPIMIYSYVFGIKKGVFAGIIYGILQAVQDPYIVHPAQFLLDYVTAFACIGLAGILSSAKKLENYPQFKFLLGAIVAGVGRFIMHFLSGIFAFGSYAPEGTPVVLYSLGYQALYVFPDIIICIVVGFILFSSKSFIKEMQKLNPQAFSPNTVEENDEIDQEKEN